jgi:prepilin peptidase CpaA
MRTTIANTALGAGLGTASLFDVRRGRVPNALTLPMIVLGFALVSSLSEALMRGGLVLAVLVVGYLAFAAGIIGGGDAKLAAAIAALKGGTFFVSTMIGACLVGLVAAIAVLAYHRALFPFFGRLGGAALDVIRYGSPMRPVAGEEPHKIPYALVLTGGAALAFAGDALHVTFF